MLDCLLDCLRQCVDTVIQGISRPVMKVTWIPLNSSLILFNFLWWNLFYFILFDFLDCFLDTEEFKFYKKMFLFKMRWPWRTLLQASSSWQLGADSCVNWDQPCIYHVIFSTNCHQFTVKWHRFIIKTCLVYMIQSSIFWERNISIAIPL